MQRYAILPLIFLPQTKRRAYDEARDQMEAEAAVLLAALSAEVREMEELSATVQQARVQRCAVRHVCVVRCGAVLLGAVLPGAVLLLCAAAFCRFLLLLLLLNPPRHPLRVLQRVVTAHGPRLEK